MPQPISCSVALAVCFLCTMTTTKIVSMLVLDLDVDPELVEATHSYWKEHVQPRLGPDYELGVAGRATTLMTPNLDAFKRAMQTCIEGVSYKNDAEHFAEDRAERVLQSLQVVLCGVSFICGACCIPWCVSCGVGSTNCVRNSMRNVLEADVDSGTRDAGVRVNSVSVGCMGWMQDGVRDLCTSHFNFMFH